MAAVLKCTGTTVRACAVRPARINLRCALLVGFGLLTWGHSAAAQAAEPSANPPGERAVRQYDASFVAIEATRIGGYSVAATPGHSPMYVLPTDTWDAYRGRTHVELGLLEFYDAVDRPDLRSRALTHYILQGSFGIAGFGLMLGGGIYEYVHLGREPSTAPIGGWIVIGAGLACAITAYVLGPRPIPADQALALANQHNARLRLQLGLPPLIDGSTERDSTLRFARTPSLFPAILGTQGLSLALQL